MLYKFLFMVMVAMDERSDFTGYKYFTNAYSINFYGNAFELDFKW